MPPRIAIPMPHSADREYAERAIPQYERAVELAGGEPVRVPLDQTPAGVMKIIEHCDGVLLPGSKADVDPAKFGAARSPHAAAPDPRRDTVDELLLQDAYNMRKPILGICYGLQSLNVYRTGSLVQHIPDFLPEEVRSKVNHEAGRKVAVAHSVEIEADSKLAEILCVDRRPFDKLRADSRLSGRVKQGRVSTAPTVDRPSEGSAAERRQNTAHGVSRGSVATSDQAPEGRKNGLIVPVNSSHHQSADLVGDGLRTVARCPDDGIIEAVEGTSADHFVLAVQWHPERSVDEDEPSLAIFRALVKAAAERHKQLAGEFESVK
jgi:putative glutamine amidotransferase